MAVQNMLQGSLNRIVLFRTETIKISNMREEKNRTIKFWQHKNNSVTKAPFHNSSILFG
jgi:hypothetical protein